VIGVLMVYAKAGHKKNEGTFTGDFFKGIKVRVMFFVRNLGAELYSVPK